MKKSSLLKKITALALSVVMFMGMSTSVFAADVEPTPYASLHEESFTKYNSSSQSYDLIVKPYGSPFGKTVGTVKISTSERWDEIWECDDQGNKKYFVRTENSEITSYSRNYNMKLYSTVSETAFELNSSGTSVILRGTVDWNPPAEIAASDSFDFEFAPF